MCAIETYSYEDYKHWEGKWELIDGHPYAMAPSLVKTHQAIANMIAFELTKNIQNCQECLVVNELDYLIDEYNVLKPDVAVICNEKNDFITKAPKIVVEVISPSTAKRDEIYKKEIYQKEGVLYYILVYQKLFAKVYKNENDSYKKVADFEDEVFEFEFDGCKGEIDFKNVFSRFRK